MEKNDPAALPVPAWLLTLGSLLIAWHFLALLLNALAVESGPWPGEGAASQYASSPTFTQPLHQPTLSYLSWLKMTNHYHFPSNRAQPGVRLLARLWDDQGQLLVEQTYPQSGVTPLVHHKQHLLAMNLAGDVPVEPLPGEQVQVPGANVRQVIIWEGKRGEAGELKTVPEHLIPRDRPVTGPTDWMMLLRRSYCRYLARQYQPSGVEPRPVARVELVRQMHPGIPPDVLFQTEIPPADAFNTISASFGEFHVAR